MYLQTLAILAGLCSISAQRCDKNTGSFEFQVGAIRGVIIHNGPSVTTAQTFSAPDRIVQQAYRNCFRSSKPLVFGQNVVVLDMPNGKRVMVDTGAQPNPIFPFWANTGKMLPNLIAAGIPPASIDAVVLSHGHADHVNGLITAGGGAVFPNADVYIGNVEHAFWTAGAPDPSARIDPGVYAALAGVYSRSIAPYEAADVFNLVPSNGSPLPGIQLLPAPGHTPGHNFIKVSSGGDVLIIAGDTWISKPDQVRHPTWSFSFDTHPQQAIQSRKKLLRMVARNRYPVVVFHESFPGFGYITESHHRYDWIPAPVDMLGVGVSRQC